MTLKVKAQGSLRGLTYLRWHGKDIMRSQKHMLAYLTVFGESRKNLVLSSVDIVL